MENQIQNQNEEKERRRGMQKVTESRLWGLMMTLVILAFGFIPIWIYIVIRLLAQPDGFWQELVLGTVGIWALGGIQLVLLIFMVIFLVSVWSVVADDVRRSRRDHKY